MHSKTEDNIICNIGLMGLVINNGNMGCVALTYSLITIMEEIQQVFDNLRFIYYIFEDEPNEEKINHLCCTLNINRKKVVSKRYIRNFTQIREFKKCDIIIDFTEGDSFSDIYGNKRFLKTFFYKMLAVYSKKKYILGPQTIGPFRKRINRFFALKIIEAAYAIYSRDKESIDYIEQFTKRTIIQTTDVAFELPFHYSKNLNRSIKRVGFNASKLLYFDEYDCKRMQLKTRFNDYSEKIVDELLKAGFKVYLFSHVAGDYLANKDLHKKCPDTILINIFDDPIEAKNFICSMDIIISPRMHATIGAYSSRTPVIPLAYSRKFRGLYSEIGLKRIVDLEKSTTEEAVIKTKDLLNGIDDSIISEESIERIKQFLELFKKSIQLIVQETVSDK